MNFTNCCNVETNAKVGEVIRCFSCKEMAEVVSDDINNRKELLDANLKQRFLDVGSQEDKEDPIVIAKFFNPTGAGTWYATEYDDDTDCFFGYVSIFGDDCDEWGSFSLRELEEYKGRFGLGIERDLYCGEKPISEFNIKSLRKD